MVPKFFSRSGSVFLFFIVMIILMMTTALWVREATVIEAASQAASLASSQRRAPTLALEEFASGLNQPVDIAHAGDERLFVVEQKGTIRVVMSDGTLLSTAFLDIESQVCSSFQGGLLGLAFHPDYANNGYFFVNYTTPRNGQCNELTTHISRFRVSNSDANQADASSEKVILALEQPFADNNGGDLAFHPQDGYLYIPLGDGGTEGGITGDSANNAQDGMSLFGKVLRIEPSVSEASTPTYSIPASNPFVNDATVRDEVWAFGLRNPWRFSFDRETGDMYLSDVGFHQREEVNFQAGSSAGGENYGWRCYEGSQAYNATDCAAQSSYVSPVVEYETGVVGVSVTGGFVYRGSRHPGMRGHYIFADYAFGKFWTLIRDEANMWQMSDVTPITGSYSTFGEDMNGELYVAEHALGSPTGGKIYKVIDSSSKFLYLPFLAK